jgi:NADPH:quinone reductase
MTEATFVVASAYGGPEVLQLLRAPLADPGPGEVGLEVRSAGVNPVDWKRYSGARGTDPSALPMRLGFEAAGVILAVGPGPLGPAGPVSVGDEVTGYPIDGAYSDRVVVPASSVVPRPAGMS